MGVLTLDGIDWTAVDVSRSPDGLVFVNATAPDRSFIATRADNDPDLADLVAAVADGPADRSQPGDVGGRLTDPVDPQLTARLAAALSDFDGSVTYGPDRGP